MASAPLKTPLLRAKSALLRVSEKIGRRPLSGAGNPARRPLSEGLSRLERRLRPGLAAPRDYSQTLGVAVQQQ